MNLKIKGRKMKILAICQHNESREVLTSQLGQYDDIELEVAIRLSQGIDLAENDHYDAIFIGPEMPVTDSAFVVQSTHNGPHFLNYLTPIIYSGEKPEEMKNSFKHNSLLFYANCQLAQTNLYQVLVLLSNYFTKQQSIKSKGVLTNKL